MSKSTGNGIPDWMAALGIKKGEWLYMTKPQLRSQMRPDRPLKVQVWACGMLHTAGYKGELATTLREGAIVPLTAADIAKEIHRAARDHYRGAGIEDKDGAFASLREGRAEIRAALAALEADGLAERQTLTGKPLRGLSPEQLKRVSGQTRIFFWLRPKDADPEMVREHWEDHLALMADHGEGEAELNSDGEQEAMEVGKISLPTASNSQISIMQILHLFEIDEIRKTRIVEQVGEAACQKIITQAWAAAQKSFREVVNSSLPEKLLPEEGEDSTPEVEAQSPPLIRKESKDEIEGKQAGRSVEKPAPSAPTDLLAIAAALNETWGPTLGDTVNPEEPKGARLCWDIRAALDGAPISNLREKLLQRLRTKPKTVTSMGLIIYRSSTGKLDGLAADVGTAWAADRQRAQRREAEKLERERREREAELIVARDTLADPRASEMERIKARLVLGEDVTQDLDAIEVRKARQILASPPRTPLRISGIGKTPAQFDREEKEEEAARAKDRLQRERAERILQDKSKSAGGGT